MFGISSTEFILSGSNVNVTLPLIIHIIFHYIAEHQLQCDILDARANYEGRLVTEFSFSNDSRVYHYIKSLSGQNKLPDVMYWGSDSASTAAGKANLFNEFFHSVFNGNADTLTLDTLSFQFSLFNQHFLKGHFYCSHLT